MAVALLQADVLVTDDDALADLARAAEVEVLGWPEGRAPWTRPSA